jgi:hypothetical protein
MIPAQKRKKELGHGLGLGLQIEVPYEIVLLFALRYLGTLLRLDCGLLCKA